MFTRSSRYHGIETVTATDPAGREVRAVKTRPLPATAGAPAAVITGDRLDLIAQRRYADGTRFWRIADANTELEANELTRETGRVIKVPESKS